jgi:hypothetical protein
VVVHRGNLPNCPSNIRRDVHDLVEQHAGRLQQALDLVGGVSDGADRGVDGELGCVRRLIVVADAGEGGQRAGAGLLVVALGIAALADLGGGCDIDFAERSIGDAARGGAILARG